MKPKLTVGERASTYNEVSPILTTCQTFTTVPQQTVRKMGRFRSTTDARNLHGMGTARDQ